MNCVFCGSRAVNTPETKFSSSIRNLARLKFKGVDRLILRGGEPTLCNELCDLIAAAKKAGAGAVELHTNGLMLFYKDYTERLAESGLSAVRALMPAFSFSLYGNITCCAQNMFHTAVSGIENAVDAGLSLEFTIPLLSRCISNLDKDIARLLDKFPTTSSIFLAPATVGGTGFESENDLAELRYRVGRAAAEAAQRGVPLHYNFVKSAPPSILKTACENLAPGLIHSPDCPECKVPSNCRGLELSALNFLPSSLFSTPEKTTSFTISIPKKQQRDPIDELLTSELWRKNIFSYYRPDNCSSDVMHQIIARPGFSCNHRCRFCYNKYKPRVWDRDVEYTISKIIRSFSHISSFSFSGGEPSLNPNLPRYIEMLKGGPVEKIEIQTNAMRFASASYSREIAAAGADVALVSLHGHNDSLSDSVTGVPGAFRKTVKGIENLANSAIVVSLNHVINILNYPHIPDFVKFVKKTFPDILIVFSMAQPFHWFTNEDMACIPRFSDFKRPLTKALDWCLENGQNFIGLSEPCGIPLCVLGGKKKYYRVFHNIPTAEDESYIPSADFVKTPACRNCAMNSLCFGVRERYISFYGAGEIRPV